MPDANTGHQGSSHDELNEDMHEPDKTGKHSNTSQKQGGRKDLWTLIKEEKEHERKRGTENPDVSMESTLFVAGSKGSGKSSLIMRFLDRDDTPGPSVALEYTFARRTRGVNSTKDIAHIWELAAGVSLCDLLDIPIAEANIHTVAFIIVVDLSNPSTIIQVVQTLLDKIRTRVNKVLDGLEQRGSKRPKTLKSLALKKYGQEHPDKDIVNLMPVPIAIIGSKYDELKDVESEKRKLICKTLRFIAHTNGASVLFTSQKDEQLIAQSRQLLSHYAFRGNPIKTMVIDHNRPIAVMAGQDTLSGIGLPPSELAKDAIGRQIHVPLEKWKADFERYFPSQQAQATLEMVDVSKFAEPAIDAIRAQKDEEIEKLRRENDRKSKEKDAICSMYLGNMDKDRKKEKAFSRARASQVGVPG